MQDVEKQIDEHFAAKKAEILSRLAPDPAAERRASAQLRAEAAQHVRRIAPPPALKLDPAAIESFRNVLAALAYYVRTSAIDPIESGSEPDLVGGLRVLADLDRCLGRAAELHVEKARRAEIARKDAAIVALPKTFTSPNDVMLVALHLKPITKHGRALLDTDLGTFEVHGPICFVSAERWPAIRAAIAGVSDSARVVVALEGVTEWGEWSAVVAAREPMTDWRDRTNLSAEKIAEQAIEWLARVEDKRVLQRWASTSRDERVTTKIFDLLGGKAGMQSAARYWQNQEVMRRATEDEKPNDENAAPTPPGAA